MKRIFIFLFALAMVLGFYVQAHADFITDFYVDLASVVIATGSENLLHDGSFETLGPNGSPTAYTGLGSSGWSSAQGWYLWNNTFGTTITELLPSTLPGGGTYMLHVIIDVPNPPISQGIENGLYQVFSPYPGEAEVIASAWIYVLAGQVFIGSGSNPNISYDAVTSTTGQWEFLQAPNGSSPANEFVIYSYSGNYNGQPVPVPEPSTMVFLVISVISLGWAGIKFKAHIVG